MKKVTGSGFCILLTISLILTGFARKVDTQGNTTDITPQHIEEVGFSLPLTAVKKTLSIACQDSYYSMMTYSEAPVMLELQKKANIELEWQLVPPANYLNVMRPRLFAGSELPDIVQMPDMDWNMIYIRAGILMPLSGIVEKVAFNLNEFLENKPEIRKMMTAADGEIYMIPGIGNEKALMPTLMLNRLWLEKSGIEIPQTTDEFYEALVRFKNDDPNGNGRQDEIPLTIEPAYLGIVLGGAFGINLGGSRITVADDGKVYYSKAMPGYREYLSYVNRLYTEALLDNDFATNSFEIIKSKFARNVAGATGVFAIHSAVSFNPLYREYTGVQGIVAGIPPLSGPQGDRGYYTQPVLTGAWAISSTSRNAVLAVKFLDYAGFSEEGMTLCNWGIEGKTYIADKDSRRLTEDGRNYDFAQMTGMSWFCLPRVTDFEANYDSLPKWLAEFDRSITGDYKPSYPQTYKTAEEFRISGGYINDFQTYAEDMEIKFITGEVSLEYFDTYIERLRSLGLDELTSVAQSQYDRFVSEPNH